MNNSLFRSPPLGKPPKVCESGPLAPQDYWYGVQITVTSITDQGVGPGRWLVMADVPVNLDDYPPFQNFAIRMVPPAINLSPNVTNVFLNTINWETDDLTTPELLILSTGGIDVGYGYILGHLLPTP